MFKTDLSLAATCRQLHAQQGWRFIWRGLGVNIVAVCIPVAITIFIADIAKSVKHRGWENGGSL